LCPASTMSVTAATGGAATSSLPDPVGGVVAARLASTCVADPCRLGVGSARVAVSATVKRPRDERLAAAQSSTTSCWMRVRACAMCVSECDVRGTLQEIEVRGGDTHGEIEARARRGREARGTASRLGCLAPREAEGKGRQESNFPSRGRGAPRRRLGANGRTPDRFPAAAAAAQLV